MMLSLRQTAEHFRRAAFDFKFGLDREARFCALIGASPVEVANIVANSRASKDAGNPCFVQP